jgi:ketosteroid isomerase-like protein
MSNNSNNVAIVQQAYDCFGRGDVKGILDRLSERVSWVTPDVDGAPFYGAKSGRDGALEFFQGLGAAETVEVFEPRQYMADEDKVIVLGRYAAKVNATGLSWESDWVHIFTINNGQIAAFREFFDNAAAGRAFGKA